MGGNIAPHNQTGANIMATKVNDVIDQAMALNLIKFYNEGESFAPFYGSNRMDIYFYLGGGYNKTIDANDVEGVKIASYNLFDDTFEFIIE